MKKKHLLAGVASAVILGTAGTGFAAANPFSDVPADHWAYDAVSQLAKDGVIEGYGDGSFNGNKNITRYEMAQMIAKAMAKQNVGANDKAVIDKLAAEFSDELNNLGVRVANLEKNSDNVKWSGSFAQKYMKKYHGNGTQDKEGPWWEKEFDLNIAAKVPGTDWSAHAAIVTKWGTNKGNGWNSEESTADEWNGGNSRSNDNRLDKVWVEGNLGKTGQYVKFGNFQPWTMNGFVNDANVKGASMEHWGKNYATHIFGGRLDVKDWDVAVRGEDNGNWTDNADGSHTASIRGNNYGDFVRHDTAHKDAGWNADFDKTSWGADNKTDANWNFIPTRKDIYGAVVDYTFNKKLNGSLGYYGYRSAAYQHEWLRIGAAVVNYKLIRNLNLEGMYAHGNQGGHNDAWNVELQFRGNPWIPADRNHLFGAYLGYRYLAPDALIKSNFGDGADEGQKGWEAGIFYNLMKNCQYTLKYFRGHSITNNNEARSKVFTSISWNF